MFSNYNNFADSFVRRFPFPFRCMLKGFTLKQVMILSTAQNCKKQSSIFDVILRLRKLLVSVGKLLSERSKRQIRPQQTRSRESGPVP